MSEAIPEYIRDRMSVGEINEKTRTKDEAVLALFVEIAGDKPVRAYDQPDMFAFREILLRLPPKLRKGSKFAVMTPVQIADLPGIEAASLVTNQNRIARIQAFWIWAVKHKYASENVARPVDIRKAESARFALGDDALLRMFEQALKAVGALPEGRRPDLMTRMDGVRQLGHRVGYGVDDVMDSLLAGWPCHRVDHATFASLRERHPA